jgi:hypothetical protein
MQPFGVIELFSGKAPLQQKMKRIKTENESS